MLHYKTNDKTNDELSIQYPNCKKKKSATVMSKTLIKMLKFSNKLKKKQQQKLKIEPV